MNHNISKQLVQEAKQLNAALAFEDLTNIRESLNQKPRSKVERRRTNNWAFYQLRLFVRYKANIAGVPVVFVPPAYTSQACSRCGHIHPVKGKSFRNGKVFKCGHCGFEHDADINAAINIAALGKSVSLPESPGMSYKVASWGFRWIIPCHFDSPIKAEPYQFRQAFSFLEQQPSVSAGLFNSSGYPLPPEDFKALEEIDRNLNKFGIVPPAKDKV